MKQNEPAVHIKLMVDSILQSEGVSTEINQPKLNSKILENLGSITSIWNYKNKKSNFSVRSFPDLINQLLTDAEIGNPSSASKQILLQIQFDFDALIELAKKNTDSKCSDLMFQNLTNEEKISAPLQEVEFLQKKLKPLNFKDLTTEINTNDFETKMNFKNSQEQMALATKRGFPSLEKTQTTFEECFPSFLKLNPSKSNDGSDAKTNQNEQSKIQEIRKCPHNEINLWFLQMCKSIRSKSNNFSIKSHMSSLHIQIKAVLNHMQQLPVHSSSNEVFIEKVKEQNFEIIEKLRVLFSNPKMGTSNLFRQFRMKKRIKKSQISRQRVNDRLIQMFSDGKTHNVKFKKSPNQSQTKDEFPQMYPTQSFQVGYSISPELNTSTDDYYRPKNNKINNSFSVDQSFVHCQVQANEHRYIPNFTQEFNEIFIEKPWQLPTENQMNFTNLSNNFIKQKPAETIDKKLNCIFETIKMLKNRHSKLDVYFHQKLSEFSNRAFQLIETLKNEVQFKFDKISDIMDEKRDLGMINNQLLQEVFLFHSTKTKLDSCLVEIKSLKKINQELDEKHKEAVANVEIMKTELKMTKKFKKAMETSLKSFEENLKLENRNSLSEDLITNLRNSLNSKLNIIIEEDEFEYHSNSSSLKINSDRNLAKNSFQSKTERKMNYFQIEQNYEFTNIAKSSFKKSQFDMQKSDKDQPNLSKNLQGPFSMTIEVVGTNTEKLENVKNDTYFKTGDNFEEENKKLEFKPMTKNESSSSKKKLFCFDNVIKSIERSNKSENRETSKSVISSFEISNSLIHQKQNPEKKKEEINFIKNDQENAGNDNYLQKTELTFKQENDKKIIIDKCSKNENQKYHDHIFAKKNPEMMLVTRFKIDDKGTDKNKEKKSSIDVLEHSKINKTQQNETSSAHGENRVSGESNPKIVTANSLKSRTNSIDHIMMSKSESRFNEKLQPQRCQMCGMKESDQDTSVMNDQDQVDAEQRSVDKKYHEKQKAKLYILSKKFELFLPFVNNLVNKVETKKEDVLKKLSSFLQFKKLYTESEIITNIYSSRQISKLKKFDNFITDPKKPNLQKRENSVKSVKKSVNDFKSSEKLTNNQSFRNIKVQSTNHSIERRNLSNINLKEESGKVLNESAGRSTSNYHKKNSKFSNESKQPPIEEKVKESKNTKEIQSSAKSNQKTLPNGLLSMVYKVKGQVSVKKDNQLKPKNNLPEENDANSQNCFTKVHKKLDRFQYDNDFNISEEYNENNYERHRMKIKESQNEEDQTCKTSVTDFVEYATNLLNFDLVPFSKFENPNYQSICQQLKQKLESQNTKNQHHIVPINEWENSQNQNESVYEEKNQTRHPPTFSSRQKKTENFDFEKSEKNQYTYSNGVKIGKDKVQIQQISAFKRNDKNQAKINNFSEIHIKPPCSQINDADKSVNLINDCFRKIQELLLERPNKIQCDVLPTPHNKIGLKEFMITEKMDSNIENKLRTNMKVVEELLAIFIDFAKRHVFVQENPESTKRNKKSSTIEQEMKTGFYQSHIKLANEVIGGLVHEINHLKLTQIENLNEAMHNKNSQPNSCGRAFRNQNNPSIDHQMRSITNDSHLVTTTKLRPKHEESNLLNVYTNLHKEIYEFFDFEEPSSMLLRHENPIELNNEKTTEVVSKGYLIIIQGLLNNANMSSSELRIKLADLFDEIDQK